MWLCPSDDTRVDVGRSEMSTSHIRDELTVVRQVRGAKPCNVLRQAPPIWNQFSVSQATSGAVSAPEWWSRRGAPVTSRAAAFCTDRSCWIRPPEWDAEQQRVTVYANRALVSRMHREQGVILYMYKTTATTWWCLQWTVTPAVYVRALRPRSTEFCDLPITNQFYLDQFWWATISNDDITDTNSLLFSINYKLHK